VRHALHVLRGNLPLQEEPETVLPTLINHEGFVGVMGFTDVPPAVLGVQLLEELSNLRDRLASLEVLVNLGDVLHERVAVKLWRPAP